MKQHNPHNPINMFSLLIGGGFLFCGMVFAAVPRIYKKKADVVSIVIGVHLFLIGIALLVFSFFYKEEVRVEKEEEKKTFQPPENHRSLDDVIKDDDNFDENDSVPDRYDD